MKFNAHTVEGNIEENLEFIAHVRQNDNGSWITHSLKEHLSSTAKLSGEFARFFGNSDWAELSGY